ncbi:MAG: cell division protein FtsI [Lachnospiraceae bacterium]|nr:cell division protein FtsI [Lachnospiraceae bacterium]
MSDNKNPRRKKAGNVKYRKQSAKLERKLAGLFVAVVLVLLCLLIRISYINAMSGDRYTKQVLSQSQSGYSSEVLAYKRGDILDRNGTVLASSEKTYNVILDCKVVNSDNDFVGPTIDALAKSLGLDAAEITKRLTDDKTKNSQYQVVKKHISIEERQAFYDYKSGVNETLSEDEQKQRKQIHGVWFEEEYVRRYPLNSLACDVIGFTYDGETADWGIEGYYNSTLNGVDGRRFGYWGDENADELSQTVINPVDGDTVITTLDANIQKMIEDEIVKFNEIYRGGPYSSTKGAENIGIVVMNPNDGSVLAMASSDPYNLNNPRDLSPFFTQDAIDAMSDDQKLTNLQQIWRNFCISDTYEPGSVFKPITMSAALEDGTLSGNETFVCDGSEVVSGTRIKCAEEAGHGEETVPQVIANSCNDAIMQISSAMGVSEFCKYQRIFNFGSRTGIDLSGEAGGILYTQDTMGSVDLATNSFGQGFECTMIQEAAAISSIVNGGYYYQPHVVSRIVSSSGSTKKVNNGILKAQTIASDNAAKIRSYMKLAVDEGGCGYAKVNGYSMGGKTGTAQKIPRADGKYLVSFIGFAPYENPQIVLYVVVDEPNATQQADNRYAQWIAKDLLTEILPYMNIYPDEELLPANEILNSTLENSLSTEAEADTVADTNVPEVMGSEDAANTQGGNTFLDDGITNEEAGFAD